MPTLAGSVDMILCDLPYGTTACKWDTVIPFEPLWAQYRRLIKRNGAIVLFGSQPFTSALVMSNPAMFRYCWVWEKPSGTGHLDANSRPLKCHEDVCVFFLQQPTYNPQKWRGTPNHSRGLGSIGKPHTGVLWGQGKQIESDVSGLKYPRSVIQFDKHTSTELLHPTQKPIALMEYLIRTYTNEGETVLDNTMGSGTTGVACALFRSGAAKN
jgi:site-specific DNA-methyltransferase (adenine-specific)